MGERSFEFQDGPEVKTRIIMSIPSFWESVRGSLVPPPEQRSARTEKVDFHFEAQNEPVSTLRLDMSENKPEHVQRMLFNGPPPYGFIEFINEANSYRQMVMETCKAVAISMLLRGYGGVLNFSKDQISPADFSTAARASITFDFERIKRPGGPKEPGIITVRLVWDEYAGGKEIDVKSILDECLFYERASASKP